MDSRWPYHDKEKHSICYNWVWIDHKFRLKFNSYNSLWYKQRRLDNISVQKLTANFAKLTINLIISNGESAMWLINKWNIGRYSLILMFDSEKNPNNAVTSQASMSSYCIHSRLMMSEPLLVSFWRQTLKFSEIYRLPISTKKSKQGPKCLNDKFSKATCEWSSTNQHMNRKWVN